MSTIQEPRWWLGIDGQTIGPWTRTEIQQALQQNHLHAQTLICPVGGPSWFPLGQVPELASLLQPVVTPEMHYGIPVATVEQNPYDHMPSYEGNSQTHVIPWPTMALFVTNYCLFLMPVYHGLWLLDTLIHGTNDHPAAATYWFSLVTTILDFPVRLLLIGLFFVAGLKWQARQRSAVSWTYAALLAGFAWVVLMILLLIVYLPIFANAPDGGPELMTNWLQLSLMLFGVVFLCWELVVCLWLFFTSTTIPFSGSERKF